MRYRALFALLVPLALGGDYTPTVMDDSSIRPAVAAWFSNATAAEAAYGHISTYRATVSVVASESRSSHVILTRQGPSRRRRSAF